MDISRELKYRREKKKLSIPQLAQEADVSQTYVWILENKPGKAVSANILFRIARALDCKMDDFFYDTHYCQRCGHVFTPGELRHFVTGVVGFTCSGCATEYSDIVVKHVEEISDWRDMRGKYKAQM